MKKMLCILLVLVLCLQLGACAAKPKEQEVVKVDIETCADPAAAIAEFSVSLLQSSYEGGGKNMILSPYSVLLALAMAANGAEGETLSEMEKLFGMSAEELNLFLGDCLKNTRTELSSANSMWIEEEQEVLDSFVSTNQEQLCAEVYRADFAEKQTVDRINAWVGEKTAGRIESMLQELDPATVMLLVSALSFDGQWEKPFASEDTGDRIFYGADGTENVVPMMQGKVSMYLEDEKATGFVKDYKNGYSFIALLPKEGVSMEDYVASLSGEELLRAVANASTENVNIVMPKLETKTNLELQGILSAMGMEQAFSKKADFSRVDGTKDLYITKVLHRTFLKIDEEGTEAAASTSLQFEPKSAPIHMGTSVVLDRPYVMFLLDRQNNVLLFAGVINQVVDY